MSHKNRRRFGVWMDSHNAIIVGKENSEGQLFVILGEITNKGSDNNSSENAANNQGDSAMHRYFNEIAGKIGNYEGLDHEIPNLVDHHCC